MCNYSRMANRHVVIATDSRFRGLDDYLIHNHIPGSHTTKAELLPGGTLLSCYYKLKTCVKSVKRSRLPDLPFSLTIAAGICDFTTKVPNGEASELCYPKSKLHSVISDLDLISSLAISELQTPIHFSTIPPCSMCLYRDHQYKYHNLRDSFFSDELLLTQQKQLESDITEVNDHIYKLNGGNDVRTIRLEKNLSVSSTKRRGRHNQKKKIVKAYVYDQLYDGVHAVEHLQYQWFGFLQTAIKNDIISNSTPSDYIPEDEAPPSRSWWNERQVSMSFSYVFSY